MATKTHKEYWEYLFKSAFTEEVAVPANFYLGLCEETVIGDADGLGDLTECAAAGYARQAIASDAVDWTLADWGINDLMITGTQETFSFSGAGNALYSWFLATTVDDTGLLLASGTLNGAPITPSVGGTHKVTPTLQGEAI